MNKGQLQNEILAIIRTVFDNKKALEKIHTFLLTEIYEEPKPEEIPSKYKKAVSEIADGLSAGLICFFNPDTLEFEDIPKDLAYDPEEFEMMTGETFESAGLKHDEWNNCITIEPMESHDSFKIMEYFIDEVRDTNFQEKLINALNRRKPFANFKYLVENSDYRQKWFDFKQARYELYVWDVIKTGIS
ncbi:hypothetical protein D1614_00300 [Maribellus luteus]|uniref:Uncharacterized protein n=1 Tax=Maribellus luteus TaxID=2305463 RepID=A0A399T3J1_9BACT|nr:UPF0158 family protein [Maribellus luteus]RIJ50418.1 hypothetical protein D1614_00300 [Maribellus luteus]